MSTAAGAGIVQRAIGFPCQGDWLYGIVTIQAPAAAPAAVTAAETDTASPTRGVLVVVGGPQYKVGSHRQFTLMAEHLATQGVPVLRFDYRGMGDSEGAVRSFEDVDDDLQAAIDHFFTEVPSLREVVIWGLCDGASAALFYAHQDPRVSGLVLLNPWVRTEVSEAKAFLKHYYLSRILSPDLWRKLLGGKFDFRSAASSFAAKVGDAMRAPTTAPVTPTSSLTASAPRSASAATASSGGAPLPQRMQDGFTRFKGRILLITSGNDMTAKEFSDLVAASPAWRKLVKAPRVHQHLLKDANHTFSQNEWRRQVSGWTADWINSL